MLSEVLCFRGFFKRFVGKWLGLLYTNTIQWPGNYVTGTVRYRSWIESHSLVVSGVASNHNCSCATEKALKPCCQHDGKHSN